MLSHHVLENTSSSQQRPEISTQQLLDYVQIVRDKSYKVAKANTDYLKEFKQKSLASFDNEVASERFDQRFEALKETVENPYQFEAERAKLSTQAKDLLVGHGISAKKYTDFFGCPIQIQGYQECSLIINESVTFIDPKNKNKDLISSLVYFSEASRQSTELGTMERSFDLNDLCFTAIKYTKAIGIGVGQGLGSVGRKICHPVETIENMIMAPYHIAKGVTTIFCRYLDFDIWEGIVAKQGACELFKNDVALIYNVIKEKYESTPGTEFARIVAKEITDITVTALVLRGLTSVGHTATAEFSNLSTAAVKKIQQSTGSTFFHFLEKNPELLIEASSGIAFAQASTNIVDIATTASEFTIKSGMSFKSALAVATTAVLSDEFEF